MCEILFEVVNRSKSEIFNHIASTTVFLDRVTNGFFHGPFLKALNGVTDSPVRHFFAACQIILKVLNENDVISKNDFVK